MASMEFENNVRSTVLGTLAAGATTLNVLAGEGANFPSSFPFKLTIFDDSSYPDAGLEIVKCTARTTDALTIARGEEGTSDVEHTSGERVAMLLTAGHFDDATTGIVTRLDTIEPFIDQSVVIGASPTFDGVNITNVDADTLIVDVKEAGVSAVTKGQICAIVGSSGSKFEVQLCDCNDAALIRVLGLVVVNTAQNETGQVIYKGLLTNVDSQIGNTDVNPNGETWLAGDLLFVSTTPGGLTNVRPSSGRCIKAGRTLKGNSASDTFLAIVNTNSICACAASGEDVCSRMGDSIGVNKHSFKDYNNNEVAAIDSNGNLTLAGTVDGIDIATDVAIITSDSYIGNDSVNRAIAHGLGVTPKIIILVIRYGASGCFRLVESGHIHYTDTLNNTYYTVTEWDSTNFYVGDSTHYKRSGNGNLDAYYWVAIG